MTPEDQLKVLTDAVNQAWAKLYQGEPVSDIHALKSRVLNIAADRDCWVFNAKVLEKECKRLGELK